MPRAWWANALMTPVSRRRLSSISVPWPAGMMQMSTRNSPRSGTAAVEGTASFMMADRLTEVGRNLGRNVSRHFLQRHHVNHAHSRRIELGGDVDAFEYVVGMVAGGDNVEHFLFRVDRD